MARLAKQAMKLPVSTPTGMILADVKQFGFPGMASLMVEYVQLNTEHLTRAFQDTGPLGIVTKALLNLQHQHCGGLDTAIMYKETRHLPLLYQLSLAKNAGISLQMPGNQIAIGGNELHMQLQKVLASDPLVRTHDMTLKPAMYLPLFELGITDFNSILAPNRRKNKTRLLISTADLARTYGSKVKARHKIALNRLSLALSDGHLNGNPAAGYANQGPLPAKDRVVRNPILLHFLHHMAEREKPPTNPCLQMDILDSSADLNETQPHVPPAALNATVPTEHTRNNTSHDDPYTPSSTPPQPQRKKARKAPSRKRNRSPQERQPTHAIKTTYGETVSKRETNLAKWTELMEADDRNFLSNAVAKKQCLSNATATTAQPAKVGVLRRSARLSKVQKCYAEHEEDASDPFCEDDASSIDVNICGSLGRYALLGKQWSVYDYARHQKQGNTLAKASGPTVQEPCGQPPLLSYLDPNRLDVQDAFHEWCSHAKQPIPARQTLNPEASVIYDPRILEPLYHPQNRIIDILGYQAVHGEHQYLCRWKPTIIWKHHLPLSAQVGYTPRDVRPALITAVFGPRARGMKVAALHKLVEVEWHDTWETLKNLQSNAHTKELLEEYIAMYHAVHRTLHLKPKRPNPNAQGYWTPISDRPEHPIAHEPALRQLITITPFPPINPDTDICGNGQFATYLVQPIASRRTATPPSNLVGVYDPHGHYLGSITMERTNILRMAFESTKTSNPHMHAQMGNPTFEAALGGLLRRYKDGHKLLGALQSTRLRNHWATPDIYMKSLVEGLSLRTERLPLPSTSTRQCKHTLACTRKTGCSEPTTMRSPNHGQEHPNATQSTSMTTWRRQFDGP